MTIRSAITATGSFLPERIMSNAELESIVDTSDEWIFQRSGIRNRHISNDTETAGYMATKACERVLDMSEHNASDIDGIIVATTTADRTFPSVATQVQHAIGAPVGIAFDIQAVCAGFVYALGVADSMIKSGQLKRVLVVGSDRMSSILNWEDRTTCVLFGDGAGAVLLEAREGTGEGSDTGIHSCILKANGKYQDILCTDGGVSTTQASGHIVMQGPEVFKRAVGYLSGIAEEIFADSGFSAEDIDWLIPHQANIRIIESAAKKLSMPMDKVVLTLENHGNTSAASIPLALDDANRKGKIQPGELVLFEALGGGLTWGAALARF